MHQSLSQVQWKIPNPSVSSTPITGFHLRMLDSAGVVLSEANVAVGTLTPDANGVYSLPLVASAGLQPPLGQVVSITVSSKSSGDGESTPSSTGPFTAQQVADPPDAPVNVVVL